MSPTPPLPSPVNTMFDETTKLQANFNHSGINHSQHSDMALCNGHVDKKETKENKARKSSACDRQLPNGTVKKRGRPPKVKSDGGGEVPSKQSKITDTMKKTKRTVNRFKDVTKEELMTRLLPDRIKHNLDILIIGINPGLFAAYKGHHYAGPGNHFWQCLNMSGFVDKKMTADNDLELIEYGIGFSTIVQRTTPGAKDLSNKEIREGAIKLIEKIQFYKPKIAVFNGKGIYEIFSKEIFGQKKKDFKFGVQGNRIPDTETRIFVMPSSSARCAQFPRAQDKVHFYIQMKRLRDELIGNHMEKEDVHEVAYDFDLGKAKEMAKIQNIKQEKYDPGYDVFDANTSFPQYTVNQVQESVPGTSGLQGIGGTNKTDNNNNNAALVRNCPEAPRTTNNNNNAGTDLNKLELVETNLTDVTEKHKHLVQYLRQDPEAGPSNLTPKTRSAPLSLSPANPRLQQDVSDEQRQERVGNWVREQLVQDYDSDPPMGMDSNNDIPGPENGVAGAGAVELDGASQLSAISAGVSGSASESTSGYGSIDASSRRVRLDRVEMWVLDQQHVRRHNHQQQQLQQSIQAAVCVAQQQNQMAQPPPSRLDIQALYQHPTSVSWHQVPALTVAYPVSTFGMLPSSQNGITMTTAYQPSSMSVAARKATTPTSANGGAAMTQPHSSSADRSSPYSFLRAGARRDGGSGSSFGAAVRPPVPLYSSWGGEGSGSGGSGFSSPAVMVPNAGSLLQTSSDNNNNTSEHNTFSQNGIGLGCMPLGGPNILSPFSNM